MKKLSLVLFSLFTCLFMQAQAPAFPGAEGHGRYATGGRGGKVIHVTNLNDSGTGSLRAAVSGSAKKIIVFDVGGVIALRSNLNIGANTTIEGQTAPSPGITLRYYTVNPNGNNIIMRFIRIRRGQEKDVNDGADASTARHFTNILLDHCSLSWSIDEVASFYD
ncbi:MAG: pectate lyase, partial [Prevotella sp.]|nr:pectate lyase [Prevotella sp.]